MLTELLQRIYVQLRVVQESLDIPFLPKKGVIIAGADFSLDPIL